MTGQKQGDKVQPFYTSAEEAEKEERDFHDSGVAHGGRGGWVEGLTMGLSALGIFIM